MVVLRSPVLYLTGEVSTPRALPIVFETNNVARCRECMIAVQLEGNTITCSLCHRWRRIGKPPEREKE